MALNAQAFLHLPQKVHFLGSITGTDMFTGNLAISDALINMWQSGSSTSQSKSCTLYFMYFVRIWNKPVLTVVFPVPPFPLVMAIFINVINTMSLFQ